MFILYFLNYIDKLYVFLLALIVLLFLFCYEKIHAVSFRGYSNLSYKSFRFYSRCLDDLLNIYNSLVSDGMVNQIYPYELQLNKASISATETSFFDLHLFILNGFITTKIYGKLDNFDIVNFPT